MLGLSSDAVILISINIWFQLGDWFDRYKSTVLE